MDPARIHPIIFGGGALNDVQYGADNNMDAEGALRAAFAAGINAFDTSAYYGRSEIIIGEALRAINKPRDELFYISKAGRWETNTFDYSEDSIRRSVARSLERLGTTHLDLLLIHDVEFVSLYERLSALKTAAALKAEGKTRFIGFSGLPLEVLAQLAEVHPVDMVLSYCNLTIQCGKLLHYEQRLKTAGVKYILNASPLGMSLLRSGQTHDWHPADKQVIKKTAEIAANLQTENIELADIASQYAFAHWPRTVIGMRNPGEVAKSLDNLRAASSPDTALFERIQKSYGPLLDLIWDSP